MSTRRQAEGMSIWTPRSATVIHPARAVGLGGRAVGLGELATTARRGSSVSLNQTRTTASSTTPAAVRARNRALREAVTALGRARRRSSSLRERRRELVQVGTEDGEHDLVQGAAGPAP